MKKYISPTSCNSQNGGTRGAIPAILGLVAGVAAAKMVTKMFSVKMDDHLKNSNNLKIK